MIIAGMVCVIMFLIGLLLVFGTCLKFIIELFKDKEYTFGLFVFGMWLIGIAWVICQFVKIY